MINFKLKDFDKLEPAGQAPNLYLSWFFLTDGELWLKFGDQTIYEYSKEALQYFGGKQSPYNDYYIARFLEDFSERFEQISISIPNNLYRLTENIQQFKSNTESWLNIHGANENEIDKLTSWMYERLFDSGHLIGGPDLSFFRHKDKIRIVWNTDYTMKKGISLWTAKGGSFEINYADFVNEVRLFGQQFFAAMDKQIELTLAKDWKNITVDKVGLVTEHQQRQLEFDKNLSFLESNTKDKTDWVAIGKLYNQMKNAIK